MDLSWIFSSSGLVPLLAFMGLGWVILQSYEQQQQQMRQRASAASALSAGSRGGPSLPGMAPGSGPARGKKARKQAAAAAAAAAGAGTAGNGSGGAAAAGGGAGGPDDDVQEEEDESIMREVLEDYLAKAESFRSDLNDKRLTVEHMVLAMAEDPRFGEILSVAEGLDSESIKKAIRKSRVVFNRGGADEQPAEAGVLAKYSRDLTSLAAEGKLDPVIGRHDELRRLIDVLCRRTKNSAVLLGEPGVGKTAIVQGLAQRLADGDVPESLRESRLIALELGLLMAGATFPGEFEERLRSVLAELTAAGPKAVLFIDDIHGITGPNAQQGGGVMDASVLLKPLLARGEVRVLGCTSLDKYRKFIERDQGLERRFQTVSVEPPSVAETVSILRGLRHRYEAHHGVRISDAALAAAASLSDRYLPDRQLPDKAIDLVDEAAAKVKTDLVLKPEALDRVERRIRQLQGERKLLVRSAELDLGAAADLAALDEELSRLQDSRGRLAEELEAETRESERTQRLQDDLDRLDAEIEAAEEAGDGAKAEQLRRARRAELIRKLRQLQRRHAAAGQGAGRGGGGGGGGGGRGGGGASKAAGGKLSRAEVGEADVARIISAWTGIPLTKLVESEADRLLGLADDLHRRIIGQHEAVAAVAEAIHRSRAGMKDPNGPIASFLFLGPTGVGKTELAKALAANLFSTEQAMVRLDMSEYMEKHAVAKLIGAPPGYVGYDEGGQLTEQVRRRPYSVVLFDEVEKAHVDVFNLLLQILDDGRVTDSQGRVVSFKHAIIILTSNLGSAEIFNHAYGKQRRAGGGNPEADAEALRELVMDKVRRHFQPEFLNRIDEFILFDPLGDAQIARIVELRAAGVAQRVAEKRMKLALRDGAVRHLAAVGFDPVYGARPVKRAIQRELETPLAQAMLRGLFQELDTIVVDCDPSGGALAFSRVPAPPEPITDSEEGEASPAAGNTPRASTPRSGGGGGQQQQQQQQPIPVDIPVPLRPSRSFGGGRAGGAAAAAGGAAGSGGGGGGGSGSAAAEAAGKKPPAGLGLGLRPAGGAKRAACGGDAGEPPALGAGGGDEGAEAGGAPPARESSSGSVAALVAGMDESVAARLEGGNLPAFLKTPQRRDSDVDLPTQSN